MFRYILNIKPSFQCFASQFCLNCLQQQRSYFSASSGKNCIIFRKSPKFSIFSVVQKRWKSRLLSAESQSIGKRPVAKVSEIRRLISLARPEKWTIVTAVGFLIIASGVTISVPFVMGRLINLIFTNQDSKLSKEEQNTRMMEKLQKFSTILAGIFIVGAAANLCRVYLLEMAGARVVNRLRQQVFGSIIRQEIGFFDRNQTGELVNRLSNDASR